MIPEDDNRLSEQGNARREEMLGELKKSLKAHQQRKLQRKVGIGIVVSLLFVGVCIFQLRSRSDSDGITHQGETFVAENRSNLDGFESPIAPTSAPLLQFEKVSDEEILELLSEVGQPSFLAEVNHQVVVIPIRGAVAKPGLD